MKIIIDIPERLKEIADEYSKINNEELEDLTYYRMNGRLALFCISKCTPLPAGHGRLIDADRLQDNISRDEREALTKHQVWLKASIYNPEAPTIIEADEEGE